MTIWRQVHRQPEQEEHDLHREQSLSNPGIAADKCGHHEEVVLCALYGTICKGLRTTSLSPYSFAASLPMGSWGCNLSRCCHHSRRRFCARVLSHSAFTLYHLCSMAARLLTQRVLASLKGKLAAGQSITQLTSAAVSSAAGGFAHTLGTFKPVSGRSAGAVEVWPHTPLIQFGA